MSDNTDERMNRHTSVLVDRSTDQGVCLENGSRCTRLSVYPFIRLSVCPSPGTTLIELVVVLAILGLLLGISGLALASLRPTAGDVRQAAIASARRDALQRGTAITIAADDSGGMLRFLPDGRAIGSDVDPLTGSVVSHAR